MTTSGDDDLLMLFRQVESAHQRAIAEFEEDEAFITAPWNAGWGVGIIPAQWQDDGLQLTIPPTAFDAVENAADHVLSVPRITVPVRPSKDEVEKAHEHAERMADFHRMCWQRTFEQDGDPLGRGKKSLAKGKMALKHEIRWDLLPDLPENPDAAAKQRYRRELQKVMRSEFIWRLRVVPKETIFEDLETPWDPQFVFEAFETTAIQARSLFRGNERMEEALKSKDGMAKVQYLEYWDRDQYVQWVDDVRVHDEENPYGYVPYVIRDPGWGDTNAVNKPEDRYVSIIRPNRSVLRAETRLLTEMESYLRMYVWPHLLTKNMPDVEDGEKQIQLGPAGHTDLTEDQSAEVLKFGEMPVSLLQGMARVNDYVDKSTKFGSLGGQAQRGVDTASEADMNVRNAATKLSGMVRALRSAVMTINRWRSMDVEMLGVPVTVYGAVGHGPSEVTISPRDIGGFYFTNVEMETSDEASLNLRNARTWSDLAQRMPISFRTALEKAGISNPTQEMEERMIEDLERSPQTLQVATLMMLAGLGEVGQMVSQAFQQTLQGAQPPSAAPGVPPSAGGNGGGMPGLMPPPQPNMIDQQRAEARNSAMQAAPERAFQ